MPKALRNAFARWAAWQKPVSDAMARRVLSVSARSTLARASRCRISSSVSECPSSCLAIRFSSLRGIPSSAAICSIPVDFDMSRLIIANALRSRGLSAASTSVDCLTATPHGFMRIDFTGIAVVESMSLWRSAAPSYPTRSRSCRMEDSGVDWFRQISSLLSTPRMATSSGTAMCASRQALRTRDASLSEYANTAIGLGSSESRWAR